MLLTLFMSPDLEIKERRNRGVGEMFRALRHRNFLLFWSGAFLSNTGTWMQAVAQGWLVLELSKSPFWLGVDGFMATAPGLVLTLAGGVFADLVDRRKLLIYTQIVAGIAALVLGTLVVTGVVKVWMILGLSFVTGCCMSIAGPSYLALVFDFVGREDLANAIALRDRATVQQTPGVGAKVAERIVTELKDKAPAFSNIDPAVAHLAGAIDDQRAPRPVTDAISALVNLGYGQPQAASAIAAASRSAGEGAEIAQLIRLGLKELAR